MGWQNILKSFNQSAWVKFFDEHINPELKGWKVVPMYAGDVDFESLTEDLHIRGAIPKEIFAYQNPEAVLQTTTEGIKITLDLLKPSIRSLDWFLDVTKNLDVRFEGEYIYVEGQSGKTYTIESRRIKSSGCYEVETQEGYSMCIEIDDAKPVGDNVLALTMALLNDETAANYITGIDDYLSQSGEVECKICGTYEEIEFADNVGSWRCESCGVTSEIDQISFSPGFSAETNVLWAEGPDGTFDPEYQHAEGDLFYQGNKLFTLWDPDNYQLFVDGDYELILDETDVEGIYESNGELYSEDGYGLDMEEIKELITDESEFISFMNPYYVMESILNTLGYEKDGEYWTKDGQIYEQVDGEMIERDKDEITKNLSSKAVLPINMKWTDYLKKTSKTEAGDWESALKSFISDGKKLGIPLSVMELLKLAKEATTSQSEGFETLHRPTFSEEEEEDV
tara:strand:+ start:845 stop:2203 length:1359 start_codon:yes stop_codon:yes gene_type:complete